MNVSPTPQESVTGIDEGIRVEHPDNFGQWWEDLMGQDRSVKNMGSHRAVTDDMVRKAEKVIEARITVGAMAASLEGPREFVAFVRALRLVLSDQLSPSGETHLGRYLTALERSAAAEIDELRRSSPDILANPEIWRLFANILIRATSEFREFY